MAKRLCSEGLNVNLGTCIAAMSIAIPKVINTMYLFFFLGEILALDSVFLNAKRICITILEIIYGEIPRANKEYW